MKDEHLWPGDGTIDWPATVEALKALTAQPATVLEISQTQSGDLSALPGRIGEAFERLA